MTEESLSLLGFLQLAVIFSVEQLLCQLQQVLETHEVNWKHVLCFLSTLLVYNPLAQPALKGKRTTNHQVPFIWRALQQSYGIGWEIKVFVSTLPVVLDRTSVPAADVCIWWLWPGEHDNGIFTGTTGCPGGTQHLPFLHWLVQGWTHWSACVWSLRWIWILK